MLDSEKSAYHALNIFYKGDYPKLQKARASFGSWEKACGKISPNRQESEDAQNFLIKNGIKISLSTDSEFPSILREIPWPPFAIYWKGEPISDQPKVAIVGTRKATASGRAIAEKFSRTIAAAGCEVVSGLALGIDTAAHSGALAAKGKTVAVLASGLDYIYPKQNEQLAEKILDAGGTIISEYPFGPPAYPSRFLERNRIISGLSKGVLVVEAPEGSGALATAKFAIDQNRDVFVVPGGVNQPNYFGSHGLIKAGAALVTEPEDILNALGITVSDNRENRPNQPSIDLESLDETQKAVIAALQSAGEPQNIDQMQELAKMDTPAINRAVSLLTIRGIIKEERGKYFL